jgi:hypothetical protein
MLLISSLNQIHSFWFQVWIRDILLVNTSSPWLWAQCRRRARRTRTKRNRRTLNCIRCALDSLIRSSHSSHSFKSHSSFTQLVFFTSLNSLSKAATESCLRIRKLSKSLLLRRKKEEIETNYHLSRCNWVGNEIFFVLSFFIFLVYSIFLFTGWSSNSIHCLSWVRESEMTFEMYKLCLLTFSHRVFFLVYVF